VYTSEVRTTPAWEAHPGVALGFRRLSIIDVAGGHQPLSNEDGTIWLIFNGEIYNFPALRRRLEGSGHTFRTRTDSETIVHLYEDEGTDCFQHLNGMFAIAIWDGRQRRLVLARDRLGQKPLVYRQEAERLLFSSELKSLREVPDVKSQLEIDPRALDEYLTYQYVPHPRTIYRGINKLPPAHYAVYQDGQLEVRSYWQPDWQRETPLREADACRQLAELLESSVTMRLQSDVPLGAFLSGGVDSSLIVALMKKRASGAVKTFSIGFPIAEYNETSYARRVAQHLQTEHQEFEVTPSAVDILPRLVWHYDEPFGDSSAIPTWYLSEMTRRHVTVALTGDGGDELFIGYPRYRAMRLAALLDQAGPLRRLLAAGAWQRLPSGSRQKSRLRQFKRFCESISRPPLRRYLDWIAIFNETRRAALYTDEFIAQLPDHDPIEFLQPMWSRTSARDPVTAISLVDLNTYLPCDLMTKVDIASMAHGLECRQPFLDYRLVEFAAALPLQLKYRFGSGKRLLRRAFGDLLPREIWRRPKMGFGVPLEHWFRHELKPLAHDLLLDDSALCAGFFRTEQVAQLLNEHEQGRFNHAYRLWSLLFFEAWRRKSEE
jgi:asparagine synthase (glutamine-hydrolysing)